MYFLGRIRESGAAQHVLATRQCARWIIADTILQKQYNITLAKFLETLYIAEEKSIGDLAYILAVIVAAHVNNDEFPRWLAEAENELDLLLARTTKSVATRRQCIHAALEGTPFHADTCTFSLRRFLTKISRNAVKNVLSLLGISVRSPKKAAGAKGAKSKKRAQGIERLKKDPNALKNNWHYLTSDEKNTLRAKLKAAMTDERRRECGELLRGFSDQPGHRKAIEQGWTEEARKAQSERMIVLANSSDRWTKGARAAQSERMKAKAPPRDESGKFVSAAKNIQ